VIDGTGAPPFGPVDVVVENNRITAIRSAGTPGLPLRPNRPPMAQHEIDEPGSPQWNEYLAAHAKLGTIFDPTMTPYAASRDVMRMHNADWHDKYTLPSLHDFYRPDRNNHGSYFFDWTLEDEIQWRRFYQVWFRLLNDYKKMGGRVTASDDAAFIYNTWGFGYIHELELMQEAGFHPLEVIRGATMHAAEALHEPMGKPIEFELSGPGCWPTW
jgi:hypothetical protein